MTRRSFIQNLLAVMFIVILSCGGYPSVQAETAGENKIVLEHKFNDGDQMVYSMTTDTKTFFSIFGVEKDISQTSYIEYSQAVKISELPDTFVLNTKVIEALVMPSDEDAYSPPELGQQTTIVMKSNGEITYTSNMNQFKDIQAMQHVFPSYPVGIGNRWGKEEALKLGDVVGVIPDLMARVDYELIDFRVFNGYNCAVIDSEFTISHQQDKYTDLKAESTGRLFFAPEEGKLIGSQTNIQLNLLIYDDNNREKELRKITELEIEMVVKLALKEQEN